MLLLMNIPRCHLVEAPPTNPTRIRLLARVESLMHTQIRFLVEPATTNATHVWLQRTMGQLVLHQLTGKEKALATKPTLERFGIHVYAFVGSQVTAVAESHPTRGHITHERLDFGVDAFVGVAGATLRKGFVTEATVVGFLASMDAYVSAQVFPLAKALTTDIAHKGFVSVTHGLAIPVLCDPSTLHAGMST